MDTMSSHDDITQETSETPDQPLGSVETGQRSGKGNGFFFRLLFGSK